MAQGNEAMHARVLTTRGVRPRRIKSPDLARYERPVIPGNRGVAWRVGWYLVNALLFQGSILGLLPSPLKVAVLRAFGARIGQGVVIKPRVNIKYPWFLEIGDHVWLGEGCWIDNLCLVRIGRDSCISQDAYIFTGNHDWNDPLFRFFSRPVHIGAGCWIGARATVCPGAVVRPGDVVGAGLVVAGDGGER